MVYNNNKLYKTLHYWSRDILNFDSLKNFWSSVKWSNFIVWLPLEILGYMYIEIVCFPGSDAINFEINLIEPFLSMSKKSRQKLKYLENIKKIFRWNKKQLVMTRFVAEKELFYYAISYSLEYNSWDLNVVAFIFCMVLLTIASNVDTMFQLSRYLPTLWKVTLFLQLDDSWTVPEAH